MPQSAWVFECPEWALVAFGVEMLRWEEIQKGRVYLEKLLNSIRSHQTDVSELLFLAAGVIGVCSQVLHPADAGAEMMSLAENLANHGTFANPFSILATGPTAANPPLYPLVVAGFIKILHIPILVYGAAVLGCVLANAIAAVLLLRLAVVFYGDIIPGVIAAILWLTTMQAMPGWDTNYTIAGLLFFCLVTSSSTKTATVLNKRAILAGVIVGLLFLLNPASLLVSVPWIAFLLWRTKTNLRRGVKSSVVILAVLCAFVCGWCGRNQHELGAFVARTNLGMTLYASNNDCAESSMFKNELSGCYQVHHPNTNIREAELLRTVGEVKYDRMRIADTKNWVRANPASFLKLTAMRVLEFWFPAVAVVPIRPGNSANNYDIPDWVRHWVSQQNGIAYAIWLVTGLSVPGLILMVRRREAVTLFVFAVLAVYPLMYYVVVSDMRYRYPVLWLSLLPAGYFIREVVSRNGRPAGKSDRLTD